MSGHDFSRAVPTRLMRALAPELLLLPGADFSAARFAKGDPNLDVTPEIKSSHCLLAKGRIPVECLSFPDWFGAR